MITKEFYLHLPRLEEIYEDDLRVAASDMVLPVLLGTDSKSRPVIVDLIYSGSILVTGCTESVTDAISNMAISSLETLISDWTKIIYFPEFQPENIEFLVNEMGLRKNLFKSEDRSDIRQYITLHDIKTKIPYIIVIIRHIPKKLLTDKNFISLVSQSRMTGIHIIAISEESKYELHSESPILNFPGQIFRFCHTSHENSATF